MPGILYVVATPIGNLADITDRARKVLADVAVVAAEDTRHTGQLLAQYGISVPMLALHEHNEADRADMLIRRLQGGEDVALVSDAGTPLISDPGYRLVSAAASLTRARARTTGIGMRSWPMRCRLAPTTTGRPAMPPSAWSSSTTCTTSSSRS